MKTDGYPTKDFYEAALLYASGVKLISCDKVDKVCWFLFSPRGKAESLAKKYWSKEVDVNAKVYSEAIRSLKEIIYSKN